MRILRPLILPGIVAIGIVVTGFVAADRLAHGSFRAPPAATVARTAAEPETTGTVTQTAEVPDARPAAVVGGFDTERLNALMRGEMPPPPAPARKR